MVVIDATLLMLFLRPNIDVAVDPQGNPIDGARARIEHLIQTLEKARTRVIVPTPVLSEVLVRVTSAHAEQVVIGIGRSAAFQIEPFDQRAAIEVAAMTRNAVDRPKKRDSATTYAKLKYDRQIVAIAKVLQATHIYSDDRDIRAIASRAHIPVIGLADLPIPAQDAQWNLNLESPSEKRREDDEPPPPET